jgi:hypothetical protein
MFDFGDIRWVDDIPELCWVDIDYMDPDDEDNYDSCEETFPETVVKS